MLRSEIRTPVRKPILLILPALSAVLIATARAAPQAPSDTTIASPRGGPPEPDEVRREGSDIPPFPSPRSGRDGQSLPSAPFAAAGVPFPERPLPAAPILSGPFLPVSSGFRFYRTDGRLRRIGRLCIGRRGVAVAGGRKGTDRNRRGGRQALPVSGSRCGGSVRNDAACRDGPAGRAASRSVPFPERGVAPADGDAFFPVYGGRGIGVLPGGSTEMRCSKAVSFTGSTITGGNGTTAREAKSRSAFNARVIRLPEHALTR